MAHLKVTDRADRSRRDSLATADFRIQLPSGRSNGRRRPARPLDAHGRASAPRASEKWHEAGTTTDAVRLRTLWASFQQFDVAHAARQIAGPPDAVRVVRVDFDSPRIGFRVAQREFREGFRGRIEPGDLVHVLLAEPHETAFRIALHRIDAGVLGRR